MTLVLIRLCSRVSQFRLLIMSETLLELWYRPDTKRAALLCTLYNSSLFFLVCGDHTVEQYSKFDLTIAKMYAFSFVVSFRTFRFLRRNHSNLLTFPMMLQMWVFQVRLLEIVTPKYLASLTSSRICPLKEYLFSIDVIDLVMDMELHFPGWNSIPHVSSHSSRWCRSCCNMSRSCCVYMVLYRIQILIRHQPYKSPVKCLAIIDESTHLCKK